MGMSGRDATNIFFFQRSISRRHSIVLIFSYRLVKYNLTYSNISEFSAVVMIFELSNRERCKKKCGYLILIRNARFRSGQSVYFAFQHKPCYHMVLKPNSFHQRLKNSFYYYLRNATFSLVTSC